MKLLIHAANFSGLGAAQVLRSVMVPLVHRFSGHEISLFLPRDCDTPVGLPEENCRIYRVKRRLPNSLSRLLECLVPSPHLRIHHKVLVLGDLPLPGKKNQTVLVHQPHLVSPRVNPYSSSTARYRIMRSLFGRNLKYAGHLIVQTDVMKEQITASYGFPEKSVQVIPQPAPAGFHFEKRPAKRPGNGVRLFYPAFQYPHKNHRILEKMIHGISRFHFNVELVVTVPSTDFPRRLRRLPWLRFVGRLSPAECAKQYAVTDALFFPSVLESYGLPLVEAMAAGIPVVCSDLPYARWLCRNQGIYFDPENGDSACKAVEALHRRLSKGWKPDWQSPLSRLPKSWDEVADRMTAVLLTP